MTNVQDHLRMTQKLVATKSASQRHTQSTSKSMILARPNACSVSTKSCLPTQTDLSRTHILDSHLGDLHRSFHRVTTERFPQFLVQDDFDEGCFVPFHLTFNGGGQSFFKLLRCLHFDSNQTASFGHFGILHS